MKTIVYKLMLIFFSHQCKISIVSWLIRFRSATDMQSLAFLLLWLNLFLLSVEKDAASTVNKTTIDRKVNNQLSLMELNYHGQVKDIHINCEKFRVTSLIF